MNTLLKTEKSKVGRKPSKNPLGAATSVNLTKSLDESLDFHVALLNNYLMNRKDLPEINKTFLIRLLIWQHIYDSGILAPDTLREDIESSVKGAKELLSKLKETLFEQKQLEEQCKTESERNDLKRSKINKFRRGKELEELNKNFKIVLRKLSEAQVRCLEISESFDVNRELISMQHELYSDTYTTLLSDGINLPEEEYNTIKDTLESKLQEASNIIDKTIKNNML